MIVTGTHNRQSGFTIVEVYVTLIVAGLFVAAIFQLAITQTRLSRAASSYNNADILSLNNLRTYAYGKPPSWFQCVYSNGSPTDQTLISSTSDVSGITSPVSQTVVASAPYGCGGGSSSIGYPIRVVSTVIFGPDAKKVVHATYSTY